jgi:methylthioribose-1-phosphate isomerase
MKHFRKIPIRNFTKTRPVAADLFCADRRTDRYGEANSRFSQFCDLAYKTTQFILFRDVIAVRSQIHTKHINTLCGQNVELLNVKLAVHIVTTGLYTVKGIISLTVWLISCKYSSVDPPD